MRGSLLSRCVPTSGNMDKLTVVIQFEGDRMMFTNILWESVECTDKEAPWNPTLACLEFSVRRCLGDDCPLIFVFPSCDTLLQRCHTTHLNPNSLFSASLIGRMTDPAAVDGWSHDPLWPWSLSRWVSVFTSRLSRLSTELELLAVSVVGLVSWLDMIGVGWAFVKWAHAFKMSHYPSLTAFLAKGGIKIRANKVESIEDCPVLRNLWAQVLTDAPQSIGYITKEQVLTTNGDVVRSWISESKFDTDVEGK